MTPSHGRKPIVRHLGQSGVCCTPHWLRGEEEHEMDPLGPVIGTNDLFLGAKSEA